MNFPILALGLAGALLAGCGGAAGAGGGYGIPVMRPQMTPVPAPSVAPNSVLSTATINGAPAFVTSAQQPVYTSDGDTTANQSACTSGCLTIWPAVAAPSGTLPAPFASFTRADTGTVQLSYKGKPLYTFVSDTQPLVATGEGVQNFHVARP